MSKKAKKVRENRDDLEFSTLQDSTPVVIDLTAVPFDAHVPSTIVCFISTFLGVLDVVHLVYCNKGFQAALKPELGRHVSILPKCPDVINKSSLHALITPRLTSGPMPTITSVLFYMPAESKHYTESRWALPRCISQLFPCLQKLSIRATKLWIPLGYEVVHLQHLRELHISNWAVGKFLLTAPNLETLILTRCTVLASDDRMFTVLSWGLAASRTCHVQLRECKVLREMYMEDNDRTDPLWTSRRLVPSVCADLKQRFQSKPAEPVDFDFQLPDAILDTADWDRDLCFECNDWSTIF
jgi:hypothetical protein